MHICDYVGKEIKPISSKLSDNKYQINIYNQPKGVYIIEVTDGLMSSTKKTVLE